MKIEIKVINKEFYEKFPLPKYETIGSVGMDLRSTEDIVIYPGETKMISTGLAIWIGSGRVSDNILTATNQITPIAALPFKVEGQIRPRSGLGNKGLILANTIGVIDEDYQGELKICAWNRNKVYEDCLEEDMNVGVIKLPAGDRIAQLLFLPVIKVGFEVVENFTDITSRQSGGFGSTGEK